MALIHNDKAGDTCGVCFYQTDGACRRFPPIPFKDTNTQSSNYGMTQVEWPYVSERGLICGEFRDNKAGAP